MSTCVRVNKGIMRAKSYKYPLTKCYSVLLVSLIDLSLIYSSHLFINENDAALAARTFMVYVTCHLCKCNPMPSQVKYMDMDMCSSAL